MLGPFARDPENNTAFMKAFLRVLLGGFWGVSMWQTYYKSLHVTNKPADLEQHAQRIATNLRESGRHSALLKLLFASKADCEARIPEVKAPVLVVMGTKDPDFSKPSAEVDWIEGAFSSASVDRLMVDGAGHYPHVENANQVYHAIKSFLKKQVA